MKAMLKNKVVAESDDIVESGGYRYFPGLRRSRGLARKSGQDRVGPEADRGVQLLDVAVDRARHPRAASWSLEATPVDEAGRGRFGFWEDVEVR